MRRGTGRMAEQEGIHVESVVNGMATMLSFAEKTLTARTQAPENF